MHKAAATQRQWLPAVHPMRIGHPRSCPTRTWRREGRSHSQLWPHITACEMPTFRATTPHGQHGGTTSAAETQWARQRAKPKRGRAVRRAEHQTAKGGVGAPTPKATHIPEGRHRVDDSGANRAQLWGCIRIRMLSFAVPDETRAAKRSNSSGSMGVNETSSTKANAHVCDQGRHQLSDVSLRHPLLSLSSKSHPPPSPLFHLGHHGRPSTRRDSTRRRAAGAARPTDMSPAEGERAGNRLRTRR